MLFYPLNSILRFSSTRYFTRYRVPLPPFHGVPGKEKYSQGDHAQRPQAINNPRPTNRPTGDLSPQRNPSPSAWQRKTSIGEHGHKQVIPDTSWVRHTIFPAIDNSIAIQKTADTVAAIDLAIIP